MTTRTAAAKAESSFNSSLKTCGTPDQLDPIETQIDFFGQTFSRAVTVRDDDHDDDDDDDHDHDAAAAARHAPVLHHHGGLGLHDRG